MKTMKWFAAASLCLVFLASGLAQAMPTQQKRPGQTRGFFSSQLFAKPSASAMRREEETTYNYLKYTTSVGGGLSPLDKAVITNVAKTLKVSPAKLKNYNASFSSTSTRGNDLSHYASMVWNGKKIEIHATESVFNPTIRIVSILGPKNAFCAPSTVKEARRFLGL